jgi:hypothetical protein
MGNATFKMVAAGDGSPPSPSGYSYYLLAHAIATVLLLITLVAAVWQFMDWVVAPSPCLESSPQLSVSSSKAAAAPVTTSPVVSKSAQAGEALSPRPSYHYAARAEMSASTGDCPCPNSGS